MVWWKTVLKVICSIILIVSLIFFVLTFSVSSILTKENLQPVVVAMFKEQAPTNETELTDYHSALVQSCTAMGAETVEVPMGEGPEAETITLKCSDISAGGPSGLIDLIADATFNKIYYKKYECSFIECFTGAKEDEQIYILMSDFAHDFFKTASHFCLIITAVIIALIFLLSAPKMNALTSVGTGFIIAGLPFFLAKFGAAKIPVPEQIVLLINIFFSCMSACFLTVLVLGIALLVAGIILRRKQKKK